MVFGAPPPRSVEEVFLKDFLVSVACRVIIGTFHGAPAIAQRRESVLACGY